MRGCLGGFVWIIVILVGLGVVGTLLGRSNTGQYTAPPVAALPASSAPPDDSPTPSFTSITEKGAPKAAATPTAPSAKPAPRGPWAVQSEVSKVDDSTNVWLSVRSDNLVDKRFGGSDRATLSIRCMENTTSVFFQFADNFMADISGYGDITYRVDTKKAQKKGFRESTDNGALGLWNGGSSIPFAKSLFGGERLFVRAVPYNESPVEVEFQIRDLETAITPLRKACKW